MLCVKEKRYIACIANKQKQTTQQLAHSHTHAQKEKSWENRQRAIEKQQNKGIISSTYSSAVKHIPIMHAGKIKRDYIESAS